MYVRMFNWKKIPLESFADRIQIPWAPLLWFKHTSSNGSTCPWGAMNWQICLTFRPLREVMTKIERVKQPPPPPPGPGKEAGVLLTFQLSLASHWPASSVCSFWTALSRSSIDSLRDTWILNALGLMVRPYSKLMFEDSFWLALKSHWWARMEKKRNSSILDSSSPMHRRLPTEKIITLLASSLLMKPSLSRNRAGSKSSGLGHFTGSWFTDHWLTKTTVFLGM